MAPKLGISNRRSRIHPLPCSTEEFWLAASQSSSNSETERLQLIYNGFPSNWIDITKDAFQLDSAQLERLLNASASTLDRRRRDKKPLDPVASERLDRISAISMQALAVFEDKAKVTRWMATPNVALNNQAPITLCETEIGANQVRRVLYAMEYGGVA
ncbi:MAG: type II RES/Xre toxin-antitoxin system antitoxin [Enterobacteriaceae bacterium]